MRVEVMKIFAQFALPLFLLYPVIAQAETSRELAQKARVSWSAFECAVFAEKRNKPEDQERLFKLGYVNGVAFIEALKANKIAAEDFSSTIPIGFSLRLGGPSVDFIVGRVFEGVADDAQVRRDSAPLLLLRHLSGTRSA
jgi:hypothetical protein